MSQQKRTGAALPPLQKNEVLTLAITDLNNLGCGVGRSEDGQVVFVKGAVTGDTVRAKVIKVAKHYAVARLEEVRIPSPYRSAETFCKAPMACGGCTYRNVSYEHELEIKQGYVKNAFAKVGLSDVTVLPVRTAGRTTHYRNKGQYPVSATKEGLRAGFFATGTHTVIPWCDCLIQNESFQEMVTFVTEFGTAHGWSAYDERTGKGLLRHIYLRVGEKTGEIMLCLVINGKSLPYEEDFVTATATLFPSVVSLYVNENTSKDYILSCGDCEVGELLLNGDFNSPIEYWKKYLPKYEIGEPLPWDVINIGYAHNFIEKEHDRIIKGKSTPWCEVSPCYKCKDNCFKQDN